MVSVCISTLPWELCMSLHVYQHTMKASSSEQLFPCFSWAACLLALMSSCILHAAFLLYSLQFFLVILIFLKLGLWHLLTHAEHTLSSSYAPVYTSDIMACAKKLPMLATLFFSSFKFSLSFSLFK